MTSKPDSKSHSAPDLPLYTRKRSRNSLQFAPMPSDDMFKRAPDVVSTLDIPNIDFSKALPPGKSFLPFQPAAIRQMLTFMQTLKSKGVYNGYDQGLGKCCMAIGMANILRKKRVLVITSANTRANWEDEIRNFSTIPTVSVRVLYNSRGAINEIASSYCVVSYSLLLRKIVYDAIVMQPWDFVILDEAKEISNLESKRTQICIDLWNRIPHGKLMSGTPVSRCLLDLFVPCHMLMPHEFYDIDEFAEEYCQKRSVPWGIGWEYFGGKNVEKLRDIIRSNFFVRRMKDEVLPDLPKKTYQRIIFEVDKLSYRETPEERKAVIDAVLNGQNPQKDIRKQKHISAKRIETALALIKEGKYYVKDYLDAKIPVVVVTYHTVVTNALMEVFKEFNPVRLDGSIVGQKKAEVIKAFNTGVTDLLFLQIESAVGINLQSRCSTAIFWEWSYDPNDVNQAMDRLCRYGQKEHVNGYFFCVKDSTDEDVLKIVFKKQKLIEKVIVSN